MTGGSAYGRVLDRVGTAIVSGAWPAGHAETVDGLVAATGVSRSIVREVTRELAAAGLLSASPRVGLRVRPRADWDLFDVRVVRWRLRDDREAQLRELRELRAAVEPEAAALAAARRAPEDRGPLADAADALERAHDAATFLAADQRFHLALIGASGNPMLAGLSALIGAALEDRALVARPAPSELDVRLHVAVARAVRDGRVGDARDGMRRIVDRTDDRPSPAPDEERP